MFDKPIYLDHNGTTPVDPRVLEAALPYLDEHFGNPSTKSVYGKDARAGLDNARLQVARFLGCEPDEVVFTSGATESNNWVLQGVLTSQERPHVVTSVIEHPSVGKTLDYLEKHGRVQVTRVPVDRSGRVAVEHILTALRPETVLVSIMHSNNEVGTLQPIAEIGAALPPDVPLHTDAAQSAGKVAVHLDGVSFLSLAGHKMYAPKGVGALYVRRGAQLEPLLFGAGHENGRRSGTENVAYAVALGAACELVGPEDGQRMAALRDRLQDGLRAALGERVSFNGHPQQRLPNTLSVNFHGTTGAEITARCPGVAASTGPACHDGVVRLSHVLAAMGVAPELGKGAVRLSLGRSTTEAHIDQALAELLAAADALVTH
jgi:cysteine desulfurase